MVHFKWKRTLEQLLMDGNHTESLLNTVRRLRELMQDDMGHSTLLDPTWDADRTPERQQQLRKAAIERVSEYLVTIRGMNDSEARTEAASMSNSELDDLIDRLLVHIISRKEDESFNERVRSVFG